MESLKFLTILFFIFEHFTVLMQIHTSGACRVVCTYSMGVPSVYMFHESLNCTCSMGVSTFHVPWESQLYIFHGFPNCTCSMCVPTVHIPWISQLYIFHGCPNFTCSMRIPTEHFTCVF